MNLKHKRSALAFLMAFTLLTGCDNSSYFDHEIIIYETSENGHNLKELSIDSLNYKENNFNHIQITIDTTKKFQEIFGFGASFTESSAWNLATIPKSLRLQVLDKLFNPKNGAGFSLTRTHINSSDYSNSHYTYVAENDTDLKSFSIYEDKKGFSGDENEQVSGIEILDSEYDLIPMILEAKSIPGADFKIIASPWSPPSWMKEGETDYMTNGTLKLEFYGTWANYLSKYISAYKDQGISIWGITPQNEPLHAKDARWDSNGFSPEQGRKFLGNFLGPQLVEDGHVDTSNLDSCLHILIYDHNKSQLNDYVSPTYNNKNASKYAWGTAFHWYASSELKENNYYSNELKLHKNKWPKKAIIHTESSIDIDPNDPIGQYWRTSTDYAGTFEPFKTYAFDIITDLNCGVQGYIEWCMILSNEGQPNPYDNFNSAPVLINPNTKEVTYTPLYYLLSHFSKFIKPGAKRIGTSSQNIENLIFSAFKNLDGSLVIVIFNDKKERISLNIKIEETEINTTISEVGLQTIQLRPKT